MSFNSSTSVPADNASVVASGAQWLLDLGKTVSGEHCPDYESETQITVRMVELCDAIHLYCMPFLIVVGVVLNRYDYLPHRQHPGRETP